MNLVRKIFAVNGSPRLERGNTALLLDAFLEGARAAGAAIDLVYSSRLDINECVGDLQCWKYKPGVCIHDDEMAGLYPRLRQADIVVLATPVYVPLPGAFQNFLNRTCPLSDPFLETREGRTRIRMPKDVRIRQIVLVSTGGWWELGNFGTVERIAREISENMGIEFAGALLRPHSNFLREEGKPTEGGERVLAAARAAGSELIERGSMSAEALAAVSQPLVTEEAYREGSNHLYRVLRGT